MTNIIKMSTDFKKPLHEEKKEKEIKEKKELYKAYLNCRSDPKKSFHECNEILKIFNQIDK